MFYQVILFEIRQHFKKPFTWLFGVLMILQGVFDLINTGGFFATDKTYANAPAVIFGTLAGMGYVTFVVCAIFGATTLGKDTEYKMAPIIYSTPIKENAFFYGRYVGNILTLFLILSPYITGIALANYSGFIAAKNLGPFPWWALAKGWMAIFLVNVFLLYSICFALSVYTKKSFGSYGAMLFFVMLSIFGDIAGGANPVYNLADPTAFAVIHHTLEHLSSTEKNTFILPLSGQFLYSRLIWGTLSVLLLLSAGQVFSYRNFLSQKEKRRKIEDEPTSQGFQNDGLNDRVLPRQIFTSVRNFKMAISLGWLEYKKTIRPTSFKLFLGALLAMYIAYIFIGEQPFYSEASALPTTLEIANTSRPLTFFVFLFIIVFTTEMLFQNRISGFWMIADALPLPHWVTVLSKIIAMIGISLLLICCFIIFGMAIQICKGYYNFEPFVYFSHFGGRWLPKYIVYILLTSFVAGLTANRYLTHTLVITFLFASVVLHETHAIEQTRFNFMFSPGGDFNTDMNGYGIFRAANAWYMFYWLCFSVVLFITGLLLWPTGVALSLRARVMNLKKRFNFNYFIILIVAIGGFVASSSKIYRTVNIANAFETENEERAEKIEYEKTYKRFLNYPQPKINHLDLQLTLNPEERELFYNAKLSMLNKSDKSIDTLHLEWMEFSSIKSCQARGYKLSIVKNDQEFRHIIYKLGHPILPGDSLLITVTGQLRYTGFTDNDPQKELTFNGTFLSNNIIPYFGYDTRRELNENQFRAEGGLPKIINRLPPVTDEIGAKTLFASMQADRFTYNLTASTPANQIIVAPGEFLRKWRKNNRNFFHYVSARPEVFDFHILSADYKVQKKEMKIKGRPVSVEIYYHPGHDYNINHFFSAANQALTYLDTAIGAYPYQTVRIAERPRYDEDLTACQNLIILPENHGWIADIHAKSETDYINYQTTRLIALQYFQQINVSATQGYPVITRSIADYLALVNFKSQFGEAALKNLLKKKYDTYSLGRGAEKNEETPLITCDNAANYIADEKGGLELYKLDGTLENGLLEQVVKKYYNSAKTQEMGNVYDFYKLIKQSIPARNLAIVIEAFEKTDHDKL